MGGFFRFKVDSLGPLQTVTEMMFRINKYWQRSKQKHWILQIYKQFAALAQLLNAAPFSPLFSLPSLDPPAHGTNIYKDTKP